MIVGRRCVISMLAALSIGTALLPLAGAAATATNSVVWTESIQGSVAGEVDPNAAILTHPNGDVTFGSCIEDEPTEAIETWTAADALAGSRPVTASPDPQLCDGSGLTDAQGDIFSLLLNQAADTYDMVAFKPDGTNLWPAPVPLPTTCLGNPVSLGYSQPVIGSDGNIFGLVYYGTGDGCPTALKLYGINHQTGALLFADTLNPGSNTLSSDVSAYSGGLAVRADNQVTYYDYGGTVIGGPYNMGGDQIDRDEGMSATVSGRTFVALGQTTTPTSSCPLTLVWDAIEAFGPGGRLWRTPVTGCNLATTVNAMPDGGVAILVQNYATGGTDGSEVLRYSASGKMLAWSIPADDLMVDVNGNIVTSSEYRISDPTDPATNNEPEVRVDVYNGLSGTEIDDFDTVNFDDGNSYFQPVNAVGLASNQIYLALQDCPGNIAPTGFGICGTAPQLYAIAAPGVGVDYPRGAILDIKPSPVYYMALGDSYSSGEGAPDPGYLQGTDIKANRCHRSAGAWPEIVAKAVAATYPYMVFRACSGAIIQDFFYSNQDNSNEPLQLSWLNDTAGLVTLTIGGDNLDFPQVMAYCALRQAGDKTCQQEFGAIVNADLAAISAPATTGIATLATLFYHIRLDAPNAKIVVVGYPRLFPENPPKSCPTGAFRFTFLQSDMRWMNAEGLKLDDAIGAVAKRFGFTYVNTYDAFQGHELCQKDPYLNRAIVDVRKSVQDWSFHPNLKGQRALAKIVEGYV